MTSPPAPSLPPGCFGPGSEHSPVKRSPSPTETLPSQERVTCGVPSILGWAPPSAMLRVKRGVDRLAEGPRKPVMLCAAAGPAAGTFRGWLPELRFLAVRRVQFSGNLGHGGRSGDHGVGRGAGSGRREANRGPRTRHSWEGPPVPSPHPAGFLFRGDGHIRRNPTRHVSAPLDSSRMCCLHVYPSIKCTFCGSIVPGGRPGVSCRNCLLGELRKGRRKKGMGRARKIVHHEHRALLKIATHPPLYPRLRAPLTWLFVSLSSCHVLYSFRISYLNALPLPPLRPVLE